MIILTRPRQAPGASVTDRLRVPVVIPTWQEVATIEGAIASARRAGDDELIVCDGGSPDGTARLARAAGA